MTKKPDADYLMNREGVNVERMSVSLPSGTGKTKAVDIQLYLRDFELLDLLTKYLGCSRAEAIRTSIRTMVSQLGLAKPINDGQDWVTNLGVNVSQPPSPIKKYTCKKCGNEFSVPSRQPGRPPKLCSDCRGIRKAAADQEREV